MIVPSVSLVSESAFEQEKVEKSPLFQLPPEMLMNILKRLDWRSLLEFSYTCRDGNWIVMNTSELFDELFSGQIIDFGLRDLSTDPEDILNMNAWAFSIAMGIHNPNQGMEYRRTHLETVFQVTSCMEMASRIHRSSAVRILFQGARELNEALLFDQKNEFLARFVPRLALLDCEKALQVSEMIEDPIEREISKVYVLKYLPERQKEDFIHQVILPMNFSNISIYKRRTILDCVAPIASFPIMKILIERALEASFGSWPQDLYYISRFAFPLFKHEPEWVLSVAERIADTQFQIEAQCKLAAVRFPSEPEMAKEHVRKAIDLLSQCTSKSGSYIDIADAFSLWDKGEAEKYYGLAIEEALADDKPHYSLHGWINKLSIINLDAALMYIEKMDDDLHKGISLCDIGLRIKDSNLYKKGIDHILQSKEGSYQYVRFCSKNINTFGEELAIQTAKRLNDPAEKAQELFRIAKRILPQDLEMARGLIKETIAISAKMTVPKKHLMNLIQFIYPNIC